MKNHPSLLALNAFTLLLFLFFSSPIVANAQKVTDEKPFEINYYDEDWKLVTDRKKAQYYRHVFKTSDPEKVLIKDFYMSGQLQFEGLATDYDARDANKLANEGTCRWYEADGRLSKEAEYRSGKQEGLSKTWNDDGHLTVEYYVNDVQEGPSNIFNKDGLLIGRINYSSGVVEKFNVACFPECQKIYLEDFSDRFEATYRDWSFDDSTTFADPSGIYIPLVPETELVQVNGLELKNSGVWMISMDFSFWKPKGKVEHGFAFGAKGRADLVAFTVSSDGTFSISERRNDVDRVIVDRRKSSAIVRGDNKMNSLTVRRDDEGFDFLINGEVVHSQESVRWHGGDVAFLSRGGQGQIGVWKFAYMTPTERPTDTELKPPAWWSGTASGFILSTDGFVVTNHHVIEDATRVELDVKVGEEWKSVEAEVVAFDAASDLAILKIDSKAIGHIRSIPYSINPDPANLGTKVFTLGFPETNVLGSELKFTEGSVSSRSGFKGDVTTYQISVPLHHGNSGGPLFNEEGNLIGVVNSGVPSMQNVSYGVKASYLVDMIKSMDNGPKIPTQNNLEKMTQTERIKALSELVVFIKVKD